MTEDEIDLLLVELEELLSGLNLDFIVAQERVTAAEGITKLGAEFARAGESDPFYSQFMSMDTLPSEPDENILFEGFRQSARTIPRKQRPKKDDVFVAPLDNHARLTLLLDLIEVATAGTLAMERYVHDELAALRDLTYDGPGSEMDAAIDATQREWAEFWNGTVIFADPPEAELRRSSQQSWIIAINSAFNEKVARARAVFELIESLRARAGVSRGDWLARGAPDGGDAWSPGKGAW